MLADLVKINWEPEMVLGTWLEIISKDTLVELGKRGTIRKELRWEEMGTEKGNEAVVGLKGRRGSNKLRRKLCWFKKNLLTKHFYFF